MSSIQLALNDVACTGCIGKIKRGMKKYRGVEKVKTFPTFINHKLHHRVPFINDAKRDSKIGQNGIQQPSNQQK